MRSLERVVERLGESASFWTKAVLLAMDLSMLQWKMTGALLDIKHATTMITLKLPQPNVSKTRPDHRLGLVG